MAMPKALVLKPLPDVAKDTAKKQRVASNQSIPIVSNCNL